MSDADFYPTHQLTLEQQSRLVALREAKDILTTRSGITPADRVDVIDLQLLAGWILDGPQASEQLEADGQAVVEQRRA